MEHNVKLVQNDETFDNIVFFENRTIVAIYRYSINLQRVENVFRKSVDGQCK